MIKSDSIGTACDRETGDCDICDIGYIMPLCQDSCDVDQWGDNCVNSCFCRDELACDWELGTCPEDECAAGYEGDTCNATCIDGMWGANCNGTCGSCLDEAPCDRVNGECEQCRLGYLPPLCVDECPSGTFGVNCESECHCFRDIECTKEHGRCPAGLGGTENGCAAGWMGESCQIPCPAGMYGLNCVEQCGQCLNNENCDMVSGIFIGNTSDLQPI